MISMTAGQVENLCKMIACDGYRSFCRLAQALIKLPTVRLSNRTSNINKFLSSSASSSPTATTNTENKLPVDSNSLIASVIFLHFGKKTKTNGASGRNLTILRRYKNLPTISLPVIGFKNLLQRYSLNYPAITRRFVSSKKSTMCQIISGKEVADEIRSKLKVKVQSLPIKPKLVIVQVGGREDSNVYIRMKIQFAESIGASAELIKLSREVTESEVAQQVQKLNLDTSVHGIITQLPFDSTRAIDSDKIVNMIDPSKDVDGLCVYNAGKLSHGELNTTSFVPCTPNGCMELIRKAGIKVEGTRSVVIGRSKIVGSPMAQLLLWNNSTVTICHSKTKNLDKICRDADIVVAAVGRAQMVKKSWIKPGAIVIDCGINVIPDATKKSGTRLVGDVDFDECKEVAGAITPVPGGVGPMTVAMLISNTVESASRRAH